MPSTRLQDAADLLSSATNAAVLTGAGVSTASGLPDFRSKEGLWKGVNPMTVATATVLREDPARFWDFYRHRFVAVEAVAPNPVHYAVAALQGRGIVGRITTQNIDGLHQAAGATDVAEVHGSLGALRCQQCAAPYADTSLEDLWDEGLGYPVCAACTTEGNVVRPGTVLFEEMLPEAAIQAAYDAAMSCDLMLVLGTSLQVQPVASLPMLALERGVPVILITEGETPYDDVVTVRLNGDLSAAMAALIAGI